MEIAKAVSMPKLKVMKYFVVKLMMVLFTLVVVSFTGLKRERLGVNKSIVTYVIELEGRNEIPPVKTDARGVAIIRVTADMQLHTRVIVHRLNMTDGQLVAATIHTGAAGANGPVLAVIAGNGSDFDKNVAQPLTAAQYESLLNDAVYVNVMTSARPSGLIRGQVR